NGDTMTWGQPFDFFDINDGISHGDTSRHGDNNIDFDDVAEMARRIANQNGGGSAALGAAYSQIETALTDAKSRLVPEPAAWILLTLGMLPALALRARRHARFHPTKLGTNCDE